MAYFEPDNTRLPADLIDYLYTISVLFLFLSFHSLIIQIKLVIHYSQNENMMAAKNELDVLYCFTCGKYQKSSKAIQMILNPNFTYHWLLKCEAWLPNRAVILVVSSSHCYESVTRAQQRARSTYSSNVIKNNNGFGCVLTWTHKNLPHRILSCFFRFFIVWFLQN